MTGAGFPQRFGDLDGSMIDVYQSMTQVTDEMDGILPTTTQIHTLLDNALGPKEYWGVFNVILHSDYGDHERLNDLVGDARERGVPIVSSAADAQVGRRPQRLVVQRHRLQRRPRSRSPRHAHAKARGLEAMLPLRSTTGPLSQLRRGGQPVSLDQAQGQGRRLRRVQRRRPAPTRPSTAPTRTRRRSLTSRPRRTPTATPRSRGRPTSRPRRWSSTAARPRSASRRRTPLRSRATRSS